MRDERGVREVARRQGGAHQGTHEHGAPRLAYETRGATN